MVTRHKQRAYDDIIVVVVAAAVLVVVDVLFVIFQPICFRPSVFFFLLLQEIKPLFSSLVVLTSRFYVLVFFRQVEKDGLLFCYFFRERGVGEAMFFKLPDFLLVFFFLFVDRRLFGEYVYFMYGEYRIFCRMCEFPQVPVEDKTLSSQRGVLYSC